MGSNTPPQATIPINVLYSESSHVVLQEKKSLESASVLHWEIPFSTLYSQTLHIAAV